MPRVAFVAHALLDHYLSTDLIGQRLDVLGRTWPQDGKSPNFINWFSFPFVPPDGLGKPVWVDFYIIPVLAPDFLDACKDGRAYTWAETVALAAIADAKNDGVHITVGWGALTKVATDHGQTFLDHHSRLQKDPSVSTTHGDAGTAALVLETIRRAGFESGFNVSVLGANGAIGDAVSRALPSFNPASIQLVGKGGDANAVRLNELRARVTGNSRVVIHQDKGTACHDHKSNLVIVATTGMSLAPSEIPAGALVLDITTPSACHPDPDWNKNRLVLTSGCGQIHDLSLPESFGSLLGKTLSDVGAGGHHVLWGCTLETIAAAVFERKGHLAGTNIPLEALQWCNNHFPMLGLVPQPPVSFDEAMEWSDVHAFVERAHNSTSVSLSSELHQ